MVSASWRRGAAALAMLLTTTALAQVGPFDDIRVHGFVSQGFLKSTANNFLGYSHRGTLDFTEGAVNVTSVLGDSLSTGIQLFVGKTGAQGNFDARFDWFNLDWHPLGWLNVRAGRIKVPFGLYNEQSDYDPGRITVLLPQSIYPLASRDFLLAATGGELYGLIPLHQAGDLSYAVVGGSIFLDTRPTAGALTVDVPYTVVGRLLWDTPLSGLRVAGSALGAELDFTANAGGSSASGELDGVLWVASVEYQVGKWKLAAEYSRWHLTLESTNPALFAPSDTTSERAYLSGEYYLNSRVSLGLYYSVLFPDVSLRDSGPQDYSHDLAATVRFDITSHLLFKLEAHAEHGTAGLSPQLNGGHPPSELTENWGLFTGKLTAFF